jgi:hypothetical protein
MRENRPYGSEGGEAKSLPYPYRQEMMVQAHVSRRQKFQTGENLFPETGPRTLP